MSKQKVSWQDTWKIYYYHYLKVNLYTSLMLSVIFLPLTLIAYLCHYPLWHILIQPQYGIPLAILMFMIQLFPINIYVLRNKTLNAQFNDFHIKLERNNGNNP